MHMYISHLAGCPGETLITSMLKLDSCRTNIGSVKSINSESWQEVMFSLDYPYWNSSRILIPNHAG